MCDLPGLFVLTEEGWCSLQWSAGSLYVCPGPVAGVAGLAGARPVRPVSLGRRQARLLSSRKVVSALKAFCSGKPSSVHLGAPLPLEETQSNITELPPSPRLTVPATVSCGVQTEPTEVEAELDQAEPCLELVIDENDVRVFRQWLASCRTPIWKVNLEQFDTDEVYKEQIFYLINPLIRLDRCPLIADMIALKQLRTNVDGSEGLTLRQFANTLGLKVARKAHPLSSRLSISSNNSISDSEDSLFEKQAARLRLRSSKLSRSMRSNRDSSDIENRHPSNVRRQETTNKTKHNSPTKRNTNNTSNNKHSSLVYRKKNGVISDSSSARDRPNVRLDSSKKSPVNNQNIGLNPSPVRHNIRNVSVSSNSSEDRSSERENKKNNKVKRRSRTISRSPIRLPKSDTSSKLTKSVKQRKSSDSRSRSRSPINLGKSDTSSKPEHITNKSDKQHKSSDSSSRSQIPLRKSDPSSKPKEIANNSDKQRTSSDSSSRSRSPIRLRKSDTLSKPKQIANKIDKQRKRKSRSTSRSPIKLRKADTLPEPQQTNKEIPNKIDKQRKSKSRSTSRSPIKLRKADTLSKAKQTNKEKPNKIEKPRSPIQLRKSSPSRSPVKSDKRAESTVKVTAVRSVTCKDSRSQSSVKSVSVSSGASGKAKESGERDKPSAVGASWKMPKFLYRKSCVPNGREYSSLEDQALVAWLSADETRARKVNGNQIWRTLEKDWLRIGGVARSWHSLRSRYLRYVLPGLQALSLPAAQARGLRAAAATGQIKGHSRPTPRASPRGAYSGVARTRLKIIRDDTVAGPSEPPRRTPASSPTYEAVTRRFALRSSTSQPDSSLPRATRRLYNPRPI